MTLPTFAMDALPPETRDFYRRAVRVLNTARVPFLVGGAYALGQRTGIVRHTKDFDLFLRREDCPRALEVLGEAGYTGEVTFEHWLAKVHNGDDFVDMIFGSGNGVANVDDLWFEHAESAEVFGEPVLLCPVEETIWSKGYICERERFDGADINHLLLCCGGTLDWDRLIKRFGPHWRVLLAHLVLFGFAYPGEHEAIPARVMEQLSARLREKEPDERVCRGTLLSRVQYEIDLNEWGYRDGRLDPVCEMTEEEARVWTEAGLQS